MIKFKSPKGQKNHKAVINTIINLQWSSIFFGILTCYPSLHIFFFPTTTGATRTSAFSLSALAKSRGRTAPPEAALSSAQHRPPARLHHTDTCWSLQTPSAKTALSIRKFLLEEIVSLKYPHFLKQLIGSVQILSKHE